MAEAGVTKPKRARRKPVAPQPTTPDAVEIAMERVAQGEPPDGPAHAVLRSHRDLLRWQTISERMSVGLKILTGLAGLAVAASLIWLVWTASRYQGLVVQAFSVPPELAARGLTGETVAGDLLDRLVTMQEQTDSVRAPGSYAIDWSDSTEIEIPQTGVSIGDLQRYLRSLLGRETRISGVIYRTREGDLAVTARTGGTAGVTFTGPESDLPALMQKAAESVYGRTQPYRYTMYLNGHDRGAEAQAIYANAERYGEPESLWLVRGWGLTKRSAGDFQGALRLYRQVERRAPRMGPLWQTIGDAEDALGRSQAAYQAWNRAGELIPRDPEIARQIRRDYAASQRFYAALARQDLKAALTLASAGVNRLKPNALIELDLLRHDLASVAASLAAPEMVAHLASPTEGPIWRAIIDNTAGRLALERGDMAQALARFEAADQAPVQSGFPPLANATGKAAALVGLGRIQEAQALVGGLPRDCYPCTIARAEVAEAAGDRRAADAWFADAARQAPSLPQAHEAWGRALLGRGDAAGAIGKLREAHRRSPNWADPQKAWGDALVAQGKPRDALGKYAQAAKAAPRWGALHLAWGRALAAAGRHEEATTRWREAIALNLSPDDRATAAKLLSAPGKSLWPRPRASL